MGVTPKRTMNHVAPWMAIRPVLSFVLLRIFMFRPLGKFDGILVIPFFGKGTCLGADVLVRRWHRGLVQCFVLETCQNHQHNDLL